MTLNYAALVLSPLLSVLAWTNVVQAATEPVGTCGTIEQAYTSRSPFRGLRFLKVERVSNEMDDRLVIDGIVGSGSGLPQGFHLDGSISQITKREIDSNSWVPGQILYIELEDGQYSSEYVGGLWPVHSISMEYVNGSWSLSFDTAGLIYSTALSPINCQFDPLALRYIE